MEFINKTQRIASISLRELTARQAGEFFKQFKNSPLSSLTVLYDEQEDALLLNRDHCLYETIRGTVLEYLAMSEDEKEKLRSREDTPKAYTEVFKLLDGVNKRRTIEKEIGILQYQRGEGLPLDIADAIWKWCDNCDFRVMRYVYQYGVIQGKRAERARKKEGARNA